MQSRSYASRFNRPLVVRLVLFALLLAVIPITDAITGSTSQSTQVVQPPPVQVPVPADGQGVYEGCLPGTAACLDHLKTISAGGFKLVMNYESVAGSASELLIYAKAAQRVGLKLIWGISAPRFYDGTALRSVYPKLAATCACIDNSSFMRYLINLLKTSPATWGYYVGDEVDTSKLVQFTAYTRLIKQIDAKHPQLLIEGANNAADVTTGLAPFAHTTDVMGVDLYPVGSSAKVNIGETGEIAQAVQALTDQNGKESAMVLQAFSWTEYPNENWRCGGLPSCPFPSLAEMQQQLTMTTHNAHPRLVLWYSYFDILKSNNPSQHWADLVTAARSATKSR